MGGNKSVNPIDCERVEGYPLHVAAIGASSSFTAGENHAQVLNLKSPMFQGWRVGFQIRLCAVRFRGGLPDAVSGKAIAASIDALLGSSERRAAAAFPDGEVENVLLYNIQTRQHWPSSTCFM